MGSLDYNHEAASGAASSAQPASEQPHPQSPEELSDESHKLRRLQIVVTLIMQVIAQHPKMVEHLDRKLGMTPEGASENQQY